MSADNIYYKSQIDLIKFEFWSLTLGIVFALRYPFSIMPSCKRGQYLFPLIPQAMYSLQKMGRAWNAFKKKKKKNRKAA